MGFYSAWPYFAGMAVVLLLAGTPLLKWADTPPRTVPARLHSIDGLRGFLALGVVFHHGAIYHQYLQTGKWMLPPTRFYTDLGQIGVALFFMITGYLFWMQVLRADGKPDLPKLYLGRVFRIVPLYVLLAVVVLLTVGVQTRWRLNVPPLTLLEQVSRWLAGGVFTQGDVNDYAGTGQICAYVTWSLHFEWIFYASLLVTSFVARKFVLGVLMPIAGAIVAAVLLQFHSNNITLAAALMFTVGMTVASVESVFAAKPLNMPQWTLSTGVAGCLALVVALFDGVYSTPAILVLGVAFALVVFGATVFGLLLTRPAKRLGDISYGIYLLQGPVLFLAFAAPSVRSAAGESAGIHWTVVMAATLVLLMLATATHALVERPGIQAGQLLWARLEHDHAEQNVQSV